MPNKKKDVKVYAEPSVYIPPDTKLNFSNTNMESPRTKYEKHRKHFDRDTIKKVVKGHYGNSKD